MNEIMLISVNDDLPCSHNELLDGYGNTKDVFVLIDNKKPAVAYMASRVCGTDLEWYWSGVKGEVTHWGAVPELPTQE